MRTNRELTEKSFALGDSGLMEETKKLSKKEKAQWHWEEIDDRINMENAKSIESDSFDFNQET